MRMGPHRSRGGRSPWQPLSVAVGRRLSDRLASEIREIGRLEPRLTATKLAAYVVAVAVSGGTLALAVGGVALAVSVFPNVVSLLLAALMVMAALLVRPRFGAIPEKDVGGALAGLDALRPGRRRGRRAQDAVGASGGGRRRLQRLVGGARTSAKT